jgi:hypothetical protein
LFSLVSFQKHYSCKQSLRTTAYLIGFLILLPP